MSGSLVCVGTGMTLGAHISPVSRANIENADIVFSLMSNALVAEWIASMNKEVRTLHPYYKEGENRNKSYNNMVEAILNEVRQGKKVVAAFYGHPGIFACVAHRAIDKAKTEEFDAHMEAGISAEDCLYADLGIDPGKTGCAHFEASQFMFYQRKIDSAAYLVLWQLGIAGDVSLSKFSTGRRQIKVLIELLSETYPLEHQIILYQAPVLAIDTMRAEKIKLAELADKTISMHTTLVIPPCSKMIPNEEIHKKLRAIEEKKVIKQNRPDLTLVK